jgi:hypothetical protein
MFDVFEALARALQAVVPALDIVEGRVVTDVVPSWCEERGRVGKTIALYHAENMAARIAALGDRADGRAGASELRRRHTAWSSCRMTVTCAEAEIGDNA